MLESNLAALDLKILAPANPKQTKFKAIRRVPWGEANESLKDTHIRSVCTVHLRHDPAAVSTPLVPYRLGTIVRQLEFRRMV